MLLSCYSPVSRSGFLASGYSLAVLATINISFFVCVLFYFCSTLEAGYRSPIVLLFKSWSKKSLLAKIKQRGSGELLAPAPPLPLLGGFIRLFL